MITLTAVRTDCITNKQKETLVELVLEPGHNGLVVRITKGGVTGYESFYYNNFLEDWDESKGWPACFGTKGRWDRLEIPAREMTRAMKFFNKIKITIDN